MIKQSNLPDARQIALNVVTSVWQDGAYANIALNQELNKYNLVDIERHFATELSYGAIKAGLVLDLILQKFVTRPLKKIAKPILNIMRLGIYQIYFLDKVPDSAACNEAVKQARRYGHEGTVRFVNAVLRNSIRFKDSGKLNEDEKLKNAILLQHPQWLVERWEKQLGKEVTEQLCLLNNQPAKVILRTNTLKIDRDKLINVLTQEEIKTTPTSYPIEGIVCESIPPLLKLKSFQQGLYQVQDTSSMLVAHYMDLKKGQLVLDLCAAPGGKTTHIATLMENQGEIVACDIHDHKLSIIDSNCKRLGIKIVKPTLNDATKLNSKWQNKADRVLVDAPCSGLGVLRRRADLRWRKQESDLKVFPVLQKNILNTAKKYVAKGGKLIYSTCTTEKAENIDLIKQFISENKDFAIEKIKHPANDEMLDFLQLWTHVDSTDGFFICVMNNI